MANTEITQSIKDITGISSLSTYSIEDAQKFVVSSIPKNLLKFAMSKSSVSNDGSSIDYPNGDDIIDVQRDGYSCREISFTESKWVLDSGSLKKATALYPVYWIQDDGVKIAPLTDGDELGYIYFIDSSEIDDDCDLRNAVIYRASASEFTKLASGKITTWVDVSVPSAPAAPDFGSDLTISVSAPTAPSAPSFTYSDVSVSDIVKPLMNISDMASMDESAPSYTKPTVSIPVLTFSSFPATSWVFPNPPPKPSVSAQVVADFSSEAPTYVPPTVSLNSAPTISDLSINTVAPVSPPINRVVFNKTFAGDMTESTVAALASTSTITESTDLTTPTYSKPSMAIPTLGSIGSLTLPAIPVIPTLTNNSVGDFGTVPAYVPPALPNTDFPQIDTYIDTDEDIELAGIKLKEMDTMIGEFGAKMQNSVSSFQRDNAEYQASIQKAIQDAQLSSSDDGQKLQKYSSELSAYQAEVSAITQKWIQEEWTQNFQKWSKDFDTALQKYQTDIQNEVNEFNKENTQYQIEYTTLIHNANQDMQVKIENAKHEMDTKKSNLTKDQQLNLQNEINKMQALVADNTALHTVYNTNLQNYQFQVNTEIQEYEQNLKGDLEVWEKERSSDLQKYQADIQNNLNSFNKENVVYQATIQEKIQEASLSDQNESRKLSLYQTDLQKYQAEVDKVVKGNSAEIQEWTAQNTLDMQKYSTDVQSSISKFQSDMQNELSEFNKENVLYQQDIQRKVQNLQKNIQEAVKNADNDLASSKINLDKDVQVELQNAINNFQEEVQEYGSKLQLYSAELNQYQQDIGKVVQNYTTSLNKNVQEYQSEVALYSANIQKYQAGIGDQAQKTAMSAQQAQHYGAEADKYYKWALNEVTSYISNNSKMIERTMAAQAAAQQ